MVHAAAVILCVPATCATIWILLRFAHSIGDRIGQNGLDLLSRLFGVLLAAMAVKIIITGLRTLLSALA
jgi:multiple antibiotic resistance protein